MKKQRVMHSEYLKWYSGDVNGTDPIYGDPKAYVTLNALLFDGIETEMARSAEGRKLNPAFLERVEETIDLIRGINDCLTPLKQPCTVWRVERITDYDIFVKEGRMPSFISTSDAGFLSSYQDKYGLVFMEMHLHEGVSCIRLGDVLEEYRKWQEQEVLIGPGCPLTVHEIPLPQQYRNVRDGKGDPVQIYAVVNVWPQEYESLEKCELSEEAIASSKRVYACLNSGTVPSESDVLAYMNLKRYIHQKYKSRKM